MKNRRKRLIVSLAVLLGVCAIAVIADPTCVLLGLLRNESFYQGRPTTYWSREIQRLRDEKSASWLATYQDWFLNLFRSKEPVTKEDLTLLKGGPEAAPVLKELLRNKNPFVRWNAAFALIDAGDAQPREVVPALCDALLEPDQGSSGSPFPSEEEFTRCRAIETLDEIGSEPEMTAAIPALVLALGDHTCMTDKEFPNYDQYIDGRAEGLLSRIGQPAVPALIQGLKNPKSEVRVKATRALAKMGLEEAREAVPALWNALNDRPTCAAAARALWTLDAETEAVVPPLLATLDDSDPTIRASAVGILGEMALEADVVIPVLLRALQDKDAHIRAEAAVALGQFGPQARPKTDLVSGEVVRALIVALKDEDGHVRWHAAWALGQFGPEAKPAVAALVKSLNENDGHIARTAAKALGQIGPDANVAVPALVKAVKDPAKDTSVPTLRDCAASAVRVLQPADPLKLPEPLDASALFSAWHNPSAADRVTEALVAMGRRAMPALCAALEH